MRLTGPHFAVPAVLDVVQLHANGMEDNATRGLRKLQAYVYGALYILRIQAYWGLRSCFFPRSVGAWVWVELRAQPQLVAQGDHVSSQSEAAVVLANLVEIRRRGRPHDC